MHKIFPVPPPLAGSLSVAKFLRKLRKQNIYLECMYNREINSSIMSDFSSGMDGDVLQKKYIMFILKFTKIRRIAIFCNREICWLKRDVFPNWYEEISERRNCRYYKI